MIKLAINGFGRIGRAALRAALADERGLGERLRRSTRIHADEIGVVAVNDLASGETLADLLKYDSVYGVSSANISLNPSTSSGQVPQLVVGEKKIKLLCEKDPAKLPWKDLDVDVVLECTGVFADFEKARVHLDAGAKKVIISANAKGDGPTVVLGTESAPPRKARPISQPSRLDPKKPRRFSSGGLGNLPAGEAGRQDPTQSKWFSTGDVISMASCTTNCIAPIMQILKDNFGVEKSLMTTTHAYTSTQNLVDGPSRDLRRARAAGVNIVPTTTGAARATEKVVSDLEGKFDGIAIRVPIPCASIADIVALLEREVAAEEVNRIFKEASESEEYRGLVEYSEAPLVSSDIIGNPHSGVIDAPFTRVVGGNLVKILAWYDNEWAYGCRLIELAQLIGESL